MFISKPVILKLSEYRIPYRVMESFVRDQDVCVEARVQRKLSEIGNMIAFSLSTQGLARVRRRLGQVKFRLENKYLRFSHYQKDTGSFNDLLPSKKNGLLNNNTFKIISKIKASYFYDGKILT